LHASERLAAARTGVEWDAGGQFVIDITTNGLSRKSLTGRP